MIILVLQLRISSLASRKRTQDNANMRFLVLMTLLLLAVYSEGQEVVEGEVDGRPIWFHYQEILNNPAEMTKLVECVTDTTKCTPTLLQVRGVIKDYYQNNCKNCCNFKRSMIRDILEYFAQVDNTVPNQMKEQFELQ